MLAVPSQTPGFVDQYGLTRAQAERELWAIDRDNRMFAGASAVNRILGELGGPWTLLAMAYRFSLLRSIEDFSYRWIANHRSRLGLWSTTPECEQPGITCE